MAGLQGPATPAVRQLAGQPAQHVDHGRERDPLLLRARRAPTSTLVPALRACSISSCTSRDFSNVEMHVRQRRNGESRPLRVRRPPGARCASRASSRRRGRASHGREPCQPRAPRTSGRSRPLPGTARASQLAQVLGRAVAVGHVVGAAAGLRETDRLREVIGERHRWHAVRGHLHELAGDLPAAASAYAEAARRATNVAERDHLVRQAARARAA